MLELYIAFEPFIYALVALIIYVTLRIFKKDNQYILAIAFISALWLPMIYMAALVAGCMLLIGISAYMACKIEKLFTKKDKDNGII